MIPGTTLAEREAYLATLDRLTGIVPEACVWNDNVCQVRERLNANVADWRLRSALEKRPAHREHALNSYHRALRELEQHHCEPKPDGAA